MSGFETALKSWAGRSGASRMALLFVAAAVVGHLWVIYSIVQQPLGIHDGPVERRAVVWNVHRDMTVCDGPAGDFFAVYGQGKPGTPPPYGYSFRYLPVVGQTLGAALALLPPRAAWWVWVLVLEALLVALAVAWWRRCSEVKVRVFGVGLLFLSTPFWLEVHMGQFTFATLALLTLALLVAEFPPRSSAVRGTDKVRWSLATVALSLASILKIFPLVVLPAFLGSASWRRVVGVVLSAVACAAGITVLLDPPAWDSFVQMNFSDRLGGMTTGNYGLFYIVHEVGLSLEGPRFAEGWISRASDVHKVVLVLSAMFVVLARGSVVAGVCVMVFAHFVGFVHVWEHHMSGLLAVGLLLLLAVLRRQEQMRPSKWMLRLLIASLVALALPTPFVFLDVGHESSLFDRVFLASSKAVPTLVLYGLSLTLLFQERRSGSLFRRRDALE